MIRFGWGRIKFEFRATAVAPSHGSGAGTGTVTPEASPLPVPAPSNAGVTVLRVTDIEPYEHNPRQSANPLFETIKASIRQRGMDVPLKVTQRPGAAHYVVAAGGNTRLLAQRQLWEETADPRFATLPVVIRAWCSESDVLAGHLIENEQRSGLTFWDKAQGVVALKAAVEQERAATLSLRQWESALLDLGLQIGKDVLSTYLFAVERLAPLGPVMATLSRNDVRDQLQPRFRCWARLAQRFGLGEAALYARTLDPVLRRFADSYQTTRSFDPTELAQQGELALAQTLQMAAPALQSLLALLDQSPEMALDELRARGDLALTDRSSSAVPAVTSRRYRQRSTGGRPPCYPTGGQPAHRARGGDCRSAFHCLPGRQSPHCGRGRPGDRSGHRSGRRAPAVTARLRRGDALHGLPALACGLAVPLLRRSSHPAT